MIFIRQRGHSYSRVAYNAVIRHRLAYGDETTTEFKAANRIEYEIICLISFFIRVILVALKHDK